MEFVPTPAALTQRPRALELAFASPSGFWFACCPLRPRAVTIFGLVSLDYRCRGGMAGMLRVLEPVRGADLDMRDTLVRADADSRVARFVGARQ